MIQTYFDFESGVLTGDRIFSLVSAHAWNLMKLCTVIALGITCIIMMDLLLNVQSNLS